jgi:DNA-directed RNA polymerase specialized sigma24 family protein
MSALLEPQLPPVADSVLLARLGRRDSTALVELERRHYRSLYAQAYGMLMDAGAAERVVRDAFSQLWFVSQHMSVRNAWVFLRDLARELARADRAPRNSQISGGRL